jgi:hypothetical protein
MSMALHEDANVCDDLMNAGPPNDESEEHETRIRLSIPTSRITEQRAASESCLLDVDYTFLHFMLAAGPRQIIKANTWGGAVMVLGN